MKRNLLGFFSACLAAGLALGCQHRNSRHEVAAQPGPQATAQHGGGEISPEARKDLAELKQRVQDLQGTLEKGGSTHQPGMAATTEPAATAEHPAKAEPAATAEPPAKAEPAAPAEPPAKAEPAATAEPPAKAEPAGGEDAEARARQMKAEAEAAKRARQQEEIRRIREELDRLERMHQGPR